MKPTALITGSTSGIGWSIAEHLADKYKLILCGRRKEKLEELSQKLSSKTETYALQFDVSDRKQVFEAIESLPKEWKSIDVLINNAGNAHGLAPIDKGEIDDFDAMMDGNVKGLLYVTKAVLPSLKKQTDAFIINLSSIAGKQTYANGTVYCASKSAVESISKGMRLDLAKYGIRVCNLAPGAVDTEFSEVRFKGDISKAQKVYEGFDALMAEDIARAVVFVLDQPKHVQIADLTILPTAQPDAATIVRK